MANAATTFEVGDRVRWVSATVPKNVNKVGTVINYRTLGGNSDMVDVRFDDFDAQGGEWFAYRFEKVTTPATSFKVGDRVYFTGGYPKWNNEPGTVVNNPNGLYRDHWVWVRFDNSVGFKGRGPYNFISTDLKPLKDEAVTAANDLTGSLRKLASDAERKATEARQLAADLSKVAVQATTFANALERLDSTAKAAF